MLNSSIGPTVQLHGASRGSTTSQSSVSRFTSAVCPLRTRTGTPVAERVDVEERPAAQRARTGRVQCGDREVVPTREVLEELRRRADDRTSRALCSTRLLQNAQALAGQRRRVPPPGRSRCRCTAAGSACGSREAPAWSSQSTCPMLCLVTTQIAISGLRGAMSAIAARTPSCAPSPRGFVRVRRSVEARVEHVGICRGVRGDGGAASAGIHLRHDEAAHAFASAMISGRSVRTAGSPPARPRRWMPDLARRSNSRPIWSEAELAAVDQADSCSSCSARLVGHPRTSPRTDAADRPPATTSRLAPNA